MIKAMALVLAILASTTVSAEAFSMASRRQNVLDILRSVSQQTGVPFGVFNTFGAIESGFKPNARTGSYKGVFQLSNKEFNRHGGGNIYDVEDNARAFAGLVKENAKFFKEELGRDPTTFDLYMMHQQGTAGYLEHVSHPDRPAWQSMHATGEGRRKGSGWSKKAIWGNLPPSDKRRYGSVNNVTSGDFLNSWKARVERFGGGNSMNAVAEAAGVSPPLPGRRVQFPQRNPGVLDEDVSRGISRKSAGYASGATFSRTQDGGPPGGGAPTVSETIQAPLSRQVSQVGQANGGGDEARLPIPFPSSRRESLGSQKGYGRLPDTFVQPEVAETRTSSAGPSRVSTPMAPAPASGGGGGYDFPWPGTAPLTWAGEGLKPGSAIPTPVRADASAAGGPGVAGGNALGVRPPLFRDFFMSIFGGNF
jgi:hypothetical protein